MVAQTKIFLIECDRKCKQRLFQNFIWEVSDRYHTQTAAGRLGGWASRTHDQAALIPMIPPILPQSAVFTALLTAAVLRWYLSILSSPYLFLLGYQLTQSQPVHWPLTSGIDCLNPWVKISEPSADKLLESKGLTYVGSHYWRSTESILSSSSSAS